MTGVWLCFLAWLSSVSVKDTSTLDDTITELHVRGRGQPVAPPYTSQIPATAEELDEETGSQEVHNAYQALVVVYTVVPV